MLDRAGWKGEGSQFATDSLPSFLDLPHLLPIQWGNNRLDGVMAKTEMEKMADKIIRVFSDIAVHDHAMSLVAGITHRKANNLVLPRILLYNRELERYKQEMSRPIYNRSNYVKQDTLW
jgi:hypothetical protein